ncbi:heme biosynthesis protein HemY [Mangrovibrevibacter kandeliae]|uniref:heme biosynthesis protein HemY n=1 Tax=Mangrovibrevibacter kandeliae TaxID=2968473 RepID=UPI0021177A28|nr:heme biosynthesis HemY N-terminal domain-containing protein [Aurantimonas sp. CSK15Z-1]MCQ8781943.1 heme biosynthesis protein HemY [Aurantimonas sp. CSK15Z-1]
MLRILAFFLLVLALALGFAWLADNPGQIALDWQGASVQTSVMVFVIVEIAVLVAVVALVWLVRLFFKTPDAISGWFSGRRRDRGYKALSDGILAVGAGDAVLARQMTKRSQKLLDGRREPLIRFLDAQTAMIEGDHARARAAFEGMEQQPETRLLALRGLYLEAERLNDDAAARHYAEQAARLAPHLPWAGGAVLESKAIAGDYDGALAILEAQRESRLVDRSESRRLRAVLLTAKANAATDGNPAVARAAGLEAHKLAPDLPPAAVAAARALFRQGELRRGSKVLEKSWTQTPHPDIAAAYVNARPGDSVSDRLARAKTLQSLRPNNVESSLAVAHAALDAQEFALAREEALAAARLEPRESIYLLLADIEDADTGNEGKVREWMGQAIRAPRDPAWTADGYVAEEWAPVSPVSGRIDAFQWKVPVARLAAPGALIEAEPSDDDTALVAAAPLEPGQAGEDGAPRGQTSRADTAVSDAGGAATVGNGASGHGSTSDHSDPSRAEESDERPAPDDPGVKSGSGAMPADAASGSRFRLF